MTTDLQRVALHTNPYLSRFDPLERILFYDDFNKGMQGWTGLVGNYEESLDSMLPEYRDIRPPMLSNLSMWDSGTHRQLRLETRNTTPSRLFQRGYQENDLPSCGTHSS